MFARCMLALALVFAAPAWPALAQQRTEQLKPWRDGIPEGDVCTGSYPVR